MKYFLRFISVYLIITAVILAFYLDINNTREKQLEFTKDEIAGIEYLESIYHVAVDAAIYQNLLETGDNKEETENVRIDLFSDIDSIYDLQKKYPKFKNIQFNKHLEQIKDSQINGKATHMFFDYINTENYRIGDISNLLFEQDRKLYFLSSLVTHYMPEYIISVLITHNVAEEFKHKGSISDHKMNQYLEHNKLMYLSSEEIQNIIKLLKPYDDTKKLHYLIKEILTELENLPQSKNIFLDLNNDNAAVENYLNITHKILELSYELNDEHINILESALKTRKSHLEDIILRDIFLLIFIFLLITIALFYFYRSFTSNIKKDFEIKKTSETLDKFVIFSKTDRAG
ncbi:MAG: hypothetical protein KAR81_05465, partial [Sulfurimonas sp.]|nr:hypothetical protein [Sulfurimonas sp.]